MEDNLRQPQELEGSSRAREESIEVPPQVMADDDDVQSVPPDDQRDNSPPPDQQDKSPADDGDDNGDAKETLEEEGAEDEEEQAATHEYVCERHTVETLSHMISVSERVKTNAWLRKIDECQDRSTRLAYIKFLSQVVAGGYLVEPFRRLPPDEPLKPLERIVDVNLLVGLTRNREAATAAELFEPRKPHTKINEKTFYDYQLKPKDGTLCYAAVFSLP